MHTTDSQFAEETLVLATRLLTEQFSAPVRLGEPQNNSGSNRARVYRCHVLEGPASTPTSVIVKRAYTVPPAQYNPDSNTMPAWTFLNELASLQFLRQYVPEISFVPRLYCGDRASGIMIMEDLGSGKRLDHLLLGNDPQAAEQALLDYARVHGILHAQTIGMQDSYLRIRRQLGPVEEASGYYHNYEWLDASLYRTASLLDVTPVPGVGAELRRLKHAMEQPGPFLSFVQSDACPDNCLYANGRLHLLDFEGGRFDHALKEGVYGRVPFPTCWCVYRLPPHLALRMEEIYRKELVKGCSEAADDKIFYRAVVESCAFWMLDFFHTFPLTKLLAQDYKDAAATARQRIIMRAELLAQTIAQFEHLEAIGATIQHTLEKLRVLWPEATEIACYPVFDTTI
ncbi:MAG TPA: hypothetical protein VL485_20835 [Ktedonobacteraceae bacterium]|jgi:hypothetical protein|nr:hypothetical protein [Ktedonobacteraceae bacterium]